MRYILLFLLLLLSLVEVVYGQGFRNLCATLLVKSNSNLKMEYSKINKTIFALFLSFFCLSISAKTPDIRGVKFSSSIANKIYKSFGESTKCVAIVRSLATFERTKSEGVFAFRLAFQPHYPSKLFLVHNNIVFPYKTLGYADPRGVVLETLNLLGLEIFEGEKKIISKGVYKFLVMEYGDTYGGIVSKEKLKLESIISYKPYEEKEKYISSQIENEGKLKEIVDLLNSKDQKLDLSTIVGKLSDEECIVLMKFLSE